MRSTQGANQKPPNLPPMKKGFNSLSFASRLTREFWVQFGWKGLGPLIETSKKRFLARLLIPLPWVEPGTHLLLFLTNLRGAKAGGFEGMRLGMEGRPTTQAARDKVM